MEKQKVTLLDFLHLKKRGRGLEEKKEDNKSDVERERERPVINEAKEAVEEKVVEVVGEEEVEEETAHVYTVHEITRHVIQRLAEDKLLQDVHVKGEISNLSQPTSGHLYFTLKDEYSELRCVMFRHRSASLKFALEDGMSVIVRGRINVYEKKGTYQLYAEEVQETGIGALYLAFEQLKKKLKGEGLFDVAHKKPLPAFPRTIGVITSPTGAAIRDLLNITRRRYPHVHILLAPVVVQGGEAPSQIITAIRLMNRANKVFERIDVLVLGRGGGSIEELWAFNEEEVARAIFSSEIPLVSAVGHETDFTIADFVADRRAATPSEAGELIVPDKREIERNLSSLALRLRQNMFNTIEVHRQRLESIEKSVLFRKPTERINQYRQTVDELKRNMHAEITHRGALYRKSLHGIIGKLDALSPLAILKRGYSICSRPDGKVVRSVDDISVGDALKILFTDGEAVSEVKGKKRRD